jgi:hypothetical protein
MAKIIKKIGKLVFYLLVFIILLPVILAGILQIPYVQAIAAKNITAFISKTIGTSIAFSNIKITGLDKVNFKDLLILDPHKDTLIYGKDVQVVTSSIYKLITKQETDNIVLRKLQFENSKFNLAVDSSGTNLQFLISYLQRNRDTLNKVRKPFRIKDIRIINSQFIMHNRNVTRISKGIDFSDMELNKLNLHLQNFVAIGDTVRTSIESLVFTEKSGFTVNKFNAFMDLCSSHLFFDDLTVITPISSIKADWVHMNFGKFKDYGLATLYQKVIFNMSLSGTNVNMLDVGYFNDLFWQDNQRLSITGNFTGALSNFRGEKLVVGWGYSSRVRGDIDLNGFPNLKETFIIFDLKELTTNAEDISALRLPHNVKVSLPKNIGNLQTIKYQGNFTGYYNDFVAHGKLTTNLGEAFTDLMFAPDSLKQIKFEGSVKTKDFNIGKLIASEKLMKDLTMNVQINGSYSEDKPLQAYINGTVNKFTFNNYSYQNILINGSCTNKKFSGELNIQDPNLTMEFKGLVDLTIDPWMYDFHANIIDANLFALHVSDIDTNYHVSFLVNANATGKSLDDLNGQIELLNSLFTKTDKQIQVYDLKLFAINNPVENVIKLRSDIADIDLTGKFQISQLKNVFIRYFSCYLPALFKQGCITSTEEVQTKINLSAKFKQTKSFFDFFFPKYLIGENSDIKAVFIPARKNLLKIDMNTPEIKIGPNTIDGLVLNISSDDSVLFADFGSRLLNIGKRIDFENLTIHTSTKKNHLEFSSNWLNWDTTIYRGKVSGNVEFGGTDTTNTFLVNLNPSAIVFNDSIWNLSTCTISIDPLKINIDKLNLFHNNQYLMAHGSLSDSPGDSLYFTFKNFNLANFNYFTRNKNLEFSGYLNGDAHMTGFKKNSLFFASLSVDSLMLNKQAIGHFTLYSGWNSQKEAISIDALAERGQLIVAEFSGDYFPSQNRKMDFHITLNKFKTDVFNPFLARIFTDARGLISGNLALTGMNGQPSLNGKLKFQKNAFTVNYLKTRYNFTSDVEVTNNNFILENVPVYDAEGNSAMVKGLVHVEHLKEISLNLNINANKLLCLNTKEGDNKLYYGVAYGTGIIKINGPAATMRFDIDAKTDKNTRISIPLTQYSDVSKYGFIKLIMDEPTPTVKLEGKKDYKVDLSGMQMFFNLDVTPDAEIQIVFDSRMGDILKGRGTGKLKMTINTLGTFDLVGDYTIEKGDYLFTAKNVINKKFNIEPGGTLQWSGDPFNAQIDLTATYKTKASLYQLFSDSTFMSKTNVDCQIFLTGPLLTPIIKYDLYLPNVDESIRERVKSKIPTEEELSKQFLALLVLNQFYPEGGIMNAVSSQGGTSNIAGVNAWELLSDQLSNWLSQITNDINVDVNYRPATTINSSEVAVALSTQLINDRLSVNGSVDMKSNAAVANSDKIVGDFDIDYKLNSKGKIRVRAFNRSNDNITTNYSPYTYTQGAGLTFTEEFNSFKELTNRYWAFITGKNKKKEVPVEIPREIPNDTIPTK